MNAGKPDRFFRVLFRKKIHMKIIKKLPAAIFSLLFLLTAASCDYGEASHARDDIPVFDEIVHAAGQLWGVDSEGTYRAFNGSNSREGLIKCAEDTKNGGNTAAELDFSFTSDDRLVCIHDWSAEYIDTINTGTPLSYDEFMSSEIFWNYTPLDAEEVVRVMNDYPRLYIVTDIKERFTDALDSLSDAIRLTFPEKSDEIKSRVVVQIYSEDDYAEARQRGFTNIIYTLYRLSWSEKTDTKALAEFARTHPMIGYTFSYELCSVDGFVAGMKKTGIPLYVHTVNDTAEWEKYRAMGIDGVYTDTGLKKQENTD